MRLRTGLAAVVAAVHLLLVALLYDRQHAITFTVLIPMVLWVLALSDYIDKTELLPRSALNITSVATIVAIGLHTNGLTTNYSRNWIMGWFILCVVIFVDVVFKFQYGNEYQSLYFIFQAIMFILGIYMLSHTTFIPWGVAWVSGVPVLAYFIYISFVRGNSGVSLFAKAILGSLAVVCAVYIGAFAYHGEIIECKIDAECPHGSTRDGSGAKLNDHCHCIDSQWYRPRNFEICLPCSSSSNTALDCCGNHLTYENVKTLRCGSTRNLFRCVH